MSNVFEIQVRRGNHSVSVRNPLFPSPLGSLSKRGFGSRAFTVAVALWINLISMAVPGMLPAGGLAELRRQSDLTPETLIRHFAAFSYELGDTIQDPERFLRRKRGDCDDFARLAALLLTERGYKARIVVVMMEGETHVVCHVPEAGGFLDFNHRQQAQLVSRCAGTLESIADKVAAEFHSTWRMVSEVRYEKGRRIFVDVVLYHPPATIPTPAPVEPSGPAVKLSRKPGV